MNYKRPDPIASTESWVSIWLGCMDAQWQEGRPQQTRQTGMTEWQQSQPRCQQVPKSIHQQHVGEGFDHKSRAVFHSPHVFIPELYGTPLGSSPRELMDWIGKKKQ